MPPPTDDDLRTETERALVALRADLDQALDAGDRALCLDLARRYRALLENALSATEAREARPEFRDDDATRAIRAAFDEARRRVLAILGTSAWDEPETPPTLPPPPQASDTEPPPLSDPELLELEGFFAHVGDMEPIHRHDAARIYRALKELRRLRARAARPDRKT